MRDETRQRRSSNSALCCGEIECPYAHAVCPHIKNCGGGCEAAQLVLIVRGNLLLHYYTTLYTFTWLVVHCTHLSSTIVYKV